MRLFAAALVMGLTAAATPATADPMNLSGALTDLQQAVENEQNLSPEFKQALTDVVDALREQDGVRSSAPDVEAGSSFFDRVQPFADMRLRHEWDGRAGEENRNRERVRFRFGATAQVNEWMKAGFRVRTGSREDPQSPYHNFGRESDDNQMLRGLEFNLDRVFMTFEPTCDCLDGTFLTIGKFGHPFASNPVYSELVWDDDVQPEGVVGGWRGMPTENLYVDLTAGQYLLLSHDSSDEFEEFSAFVAQGAAKLKIDEHWSVKGAVGYYRYGDTEPADSTAVVSDNNGNSVNLAGTKYLSDFQVLNPIASATFGGFDVPVTVSGEYIWNMGADGDTRDRDRGWAVGASVGGTQQPGDWYVFYQYQRIEQDAVFSPFSQDDFLLGTNFRGHVYGVKYKVTDRFSLRGWGLTARPEDGPSSGQSTRLRLDLDAKF